MDLSFKLIELKIKYYLMKSKYESLLKKLEKKRISKEQQKIIKMYYFIYGVHIRVLMDNFAQKNGHFLVTETGQKRLHTVLIK